MEAEYVVLWAFVSLFLITSHANGLKCFSCGWKNEKKPASDLCNTEMECGENAKWCVYGFVQEYMDNGTNAKIPEELRKGCSRQNAFIDSTKVNVCATPDELNATDIVRPPLSKMKKGIQGGRVDVMYKEYCACNKDRCNQNPETASGREAPPPSPAPPPPDTTAPGGADSLVKSSSSAAAATLMLFLWTAFNLNTFLVSSD